MNTTTSDSNALTLSSERRAHTSSGYLMLLAVLLTLAAIGVGVWQMTEANIPIGVTLLAFGGIAFLFVLCGFYLLQPNQAAAILLFGEYKGTDRTHGLRWVLPWLTRTKISTRIHNITSERVKVNDLRGNPVEIATNVVWRVTDTAQALFDVANYMEFVEIQIESAVRAIGARYAYDDLEHKEVTLRGDAEVVSEELERELQERCHPRRHHRRRMPPHPPRLRPGDRPGDAPPPAGRGGDRGAPEDRDRRRLDGRECDPVAVREGRRPAGRRAQGGDGLEPDGGALLGARAPSRSSTPARSTNRKAGSVPDAKPKKAYPLRIEPALWGALERCAAADFRSVNAEIEVLLREALARRGVRVAQPEQRKRGRPKKED